LVAVPAYFDQSIHNIDDILGALVIEADIEHIHEKLKDGGAQHKLQIDRVHGQVSEDKGHCSKVFIVLLILWRVNCKGVIREGCEYFLVVFK
jgi:hypothetical protein